MAHKFEQTHWTGTNINKKVYSWINYFGMTIEMFEVKMKFICFKLAFKEFSDKNGGPEG